MMLPSPTGSRLTFRPELDGIRAIGVVLVVAQHWLPMSLPFGEASLTTFFVLSGYLITGIVWHQRAQVEAGIMSTGRALVLFYCRRALRILPGYYFTLVLCALLPLASIRQYWPWYVLHGSNVLFYRLQQWGEGVGHFWSLAVEEQFYALWPVLLLFWPTRKQGWLLAGLMVGAFVFRLVWIRNAPLPFTFVLMPANLDAFAAGGLLRLLETHLPARWWGYGWLAALGWSTWLAISLLHMVSPSEWEASFLVVGLGAAALGAAGLLGWVLHTPYRFTRVLLLHPVVQWVGTRSYGLYLYHLPAVVVYQRLIYRLWAAEPASQTLLAYWMNPWRMSLVLTPITLALAGISWRWLERPFNNLKRYFSYAPSADRPAR
ncbi:acyltransferase [Hymenobacter sp. 5516J-16]|uniref:acyltransferase family protein n=1 Tax=Hymenobacter sp. 5516J-16 TaxID=2932253 RepID=UPI001FCFAC3F|nr:acyltransferase [Hymenobacter sp. 5516J-16]UOQ79007.1 acyltransferase [Hymenobacter sp. 5516J-16]